MAENAIHHEKTKHVEIDKHFINEKIEDGIIILNHISTKEQIADLLTKSATIKVFRYLLVKLGMINIYDKYL